MLLLILLFAHCLLLCLVCSPSLQVPHSAVAIGVTHCEVAPNHILYAANASLVALCCLGEKVAGRGGPVLLSQVPICQCVGLGEMEKMCCNIQIELKVIIQITL